MILDPKSNLDFPEDYELEGTTLEELIFEKSIEINPLEPKLTDYWFPAETPLKF